jgi:hypothetical protein
MFDTVTAGPAAGIVASFAALIVGLQVTLLTVTLYGVTPLILRLLCDGSMCAVGVCVPAHALITNVRAVCVYASLISALVVIPLLLPLNH